MKAPKSIYHCPECHGKGETECSECGNSVDCDTCNGCGFDYKKIDMAEMTKAKYAIMKNGHMLSGVVEGGSLLGWKSANGTVLIADYVIEGREEREAEKRRQAALALEPTLFPMGPDL